MMYQGERNSRKEETNSREEERKRQVAVNKAFYLSNREEIERKYMGEFVAIVDGEIHNSKDLGELQKKLHSRLIKEDKYAYVTKVGKPDGENTGDIFGSVGHSLRHLFPTD